MPKKKSKSQKKVARAMKEVFTHKPSTVKGSGAKARKQQVAIGLAKARKAGARVPKKRA